MHKEVEKPKGQDKNRDHANYQQGANGSLFFFFHGMLPPWGGV
jgi:hypothetical protein